MSKSNIAASLAGLSLVGSVVLFALGKTEGATLIFSVATGAVTWLHGYSTYNPDLQK